jgi:predicted nucleic acid-binding protein
VSFLLSTNVLSEIRKGKNCDVKVRQWWDSTVASDFYLSVIVAGEIYRGIEKLMMTNPAMARKFQNWLVSVVQEFEGRTLAIDLKTAEIWGRLRSKRTLPPADGLLAATALAHDLTLVTRNTKDIRGTGVRYLNPFEA